MHQRARGVALLGQQPERHDGIGLFNDDVRHIGFNIIDINRGRYGEARGSRWREEQRIRAACALEIKE